MPLVAIGDGAATVTTNHGCTTETTSDEKSSKVFVTGIGVVRLGDLLTEHTIPAGPSCPPHVVPLTSASSKVFADGIAVGRQGDDYTGETISDAGQTKVIAG